MRFRIFFAKHGQNHCLFTNDITTAVYLTAQLKKLPNVENVVWHDRFHIETLQSGAGMEV